MDLIPPKVEIAVHIYFHVQNMENYLLITFQDNQLTKVIKCFCEGGKPNRNDTLSHNLLLVLGITFRSNA